MLKRLGDKTWTPEGRKSESSDSSEEDIVSDIVSEDESDYFTNSDSPSVPAELNPVGDKTKHSPRQHVLKRENREEDTIEVTVNPPKKKKRGLEKIGKKKDDAAASDAATNEGKKRQNNSQSRNRVALDDAMRMIDVSVKDSSTKTGGFRGSFFCKACSKQMLNPEDLATHLQTKKHLSKSRAWDNKQKDILQIREEFNKENFQNESDSQTGTDSDNA